MVIKPGQIIAGHRAARLRDVFRRLRDSVWGPEELRRGLRLSHPGARALASKLEDLGYIKRSDPQRFPDGWELTNLGRRLAHASAAAPIRRKNAKHLLDRFLERVREVNANPGFLCEVERVVVFGGYLSNRGRLSDIDVAVRLAPRERDPERYTRLLEKHVRRARARGHTFSDFTDMLSWPEYEVLLYLKERSRGLKIHTDEDPALEEAEQRILYKRRR